MGFEEAETIDGGATQEEILRDVGLLLAIALCFAVVVGAFFSVG